MGSGPKDIFIELILILVLTFISAFFSASEIAIVSMNKNKLNLLVEEGNPQAEIIKQLLSEPSKFLATIQTGITMSSFLASATAATSISNNFAFWLKKLNVPGSQQIAVVVITVLLAFFTLVFGELFPKRIALQKSEKLALGAAKTVLFTSKFALPFVKLLTFSTNLLLRLFAINSENLEEKVSEEEIRSLIEVGEETGIINEIEKDMIDSIFEFDDTLAKEIMTPRTHVFDLDINTSSLEMIDKIIEEQYSRIPVYDDDSDNIIGVLYMKDIFSHIKSNNLENLDIRSLLRPAYFVPETKKIDSLFKELQATNNHMAIIIDEYGGFSGIVTIEDLVEEIMGNISDEHDVSDEYIKKVDNTTYLVNGLAPIDDVNKVFNQAISSSDFDTIGGFIITLLGSIPKENEVISIEYENLLINVTKITENRIEELNISIKL
jgi:putative hemolysin